ncbi:ribosome biogenesis GTPase Der [Dethiosulfatarculus sandiegensis]|uniref:GTPase Der n=1 Tax=Dethiosulfatarculus sandiegensis TaxID=1429043 RepID=A0A0D2J6W7_9BACT|nr:ribosome biogenesis GTPase Der [Dethiosulfatarculus sandiegensis]KIX11421.1 GTPase Der [Dethiosulfatarculus sandiegensis]
MTTPIVAVVGRPNVGKSTLFNRLTKSKMALVDDLPGVTRDRLYGRVESYEKPFTLIDTGGFDPPADQAFADEVHAQIKLAMEEADLILFLTDGKYGLSPLDSHVADMLRRSHKPVIACVNKIDSPEKEDAASEFYALGITPLHFISSAHGYGIWDMMQDVMAALPSVEEEDEDNSGEIRVTLLGRPNVGKSSLLNALVGSPRVVVSDVAGTTRDTIDTPFTFDGQDYVLIDTAGIRKLGRVEKGIEKAGVFRSLRSLERAHVAVVVLDAFEGITDQDLRLAGQAVESYRGLVVVLNKWDLLKGEEYKQRRLKERLESAFRFAPYAPVVKISALTKKGVNRVLPQVKKVFEEYNKRIATGPLNKAMEMILAKHQPPMVKGKRLKFYYASQVANRPPTIVLFVNNPKAVHFSYRRYLNNELRGVMGLTKAPLRLLFRERSGRKSHKGRP